MTTSSPSISLRPLSIGQLLDQAIRLYRNNFIQFIGIIAIVQVPVALLSIVVTVLGFGDILTQMVQPGSTPATEEALAAAFGAIAISMVIGLVGAFLLWVVGASALVRSTTDSLIGIPSAIIEAYQKSKRSWGALLFTMLIFALFILVALLATVFIPCVGWLFGPSLLAVMGTVVFPLITPIVTLEGKRGISAIRRAWDLTRRRFWPVLGFVFILYLFAQLIISGPTYLAQFITSLFTGESITNGTTSLVSLVSQSIVGMVFGVLYIPLQIIAITLLYFDLRVRTEGFDMVVQASGALSPEDIFAGTTAGSSSTPDLNTLIAQAPPAETSAVITSKEAGYLAILTLIVVGLYFLLFGIIFVILMAASAAMTL